MAPEMYDCQSKHLIRNTSVVPSSTASRFSVARFNHIDISRNLWFIAVNWTRSSLAYITCAFNGTIVKLPSS
ncbi:hypothetical protein C8R43DRAFT_1129152 [Mycena crocata]|nr:hypothetical protein C8R43DRAFT_1143701 [Mycena crocata]KAJ7148530.1 hypothetical protein C8R43DRAFT_1129152 [Mycena crocata]